MPNFKIPLGTEIFPYSTETSNAGPGNLTTVEVTFRPSDILERLSRNDPVTNGAVDFIRLTLGENPSAYDSYLVRRSDVVETSQETGESGT